MSKSVAKRRFHRESLKSTKEKMFSKLAREGVSKGRATSRKSRSPKELWVFGVVLRCILMILRACQRLQRAAQGLPSVQSKPSPKWHHRWPGKVLSRDLPAVPERHKRYGRRSQVQLCRLSVTGNWFIVTHSAIILIHSWKIWIRIKWKWRRTTLIISDFLNFALLATEHSHCTRPFLYAPFISNLPWSGRAIYEDTSSH